MWDKFVELYKESVVIQGVIALLVVITVCVLYLTNREVPQSLLAVLFAILGYYFGQKKYKVGV